MIIASPIWDQGRIPKNPILAFTIMPFRTKWSPYVYNDFIKPALIAKGLESQRADEMTGRNVLQDIWRAIYSCRLVIAEITKPNANVYYELGIAHTLGKKAILLTQKIEAVPFDLRQQRIILYSDDHPGYKKLQSELSQHITAVLAEPIDELYTLRSIYGGFHVRNAKETLILRGEQFESADIIDDMEIIGTRENVPLLNKVVEHVGILTNFTCNHRCIRSTEYADVFRMAALFDEPYIQIGTNERVTFGFSLENGFKGDHNRWDYDIAVDTFKLTFELRVPISFSARVRITKYVKPIDHDLRVINPELKDNQKIYRAEVNEPEAGEVYAIVWY